MTTKEQNISDMVQMTEDEVRAESDEVVYSSPNCIRGE